MFRLLSLLLLVSLQVQAKLVVHEWGTFTSLVGSGGRAQSGMYHEDELLPDFVHNFGAKKNLDIVQTFARDPFPRDPRPQPSPTPPPPCNGHPKVPCEFLLDQTITQKMETPVVYFYSDREQNVNFDVSFPGGIISQSFPAPLLSRPQAIPGVELKNGFAHYEVRILKNSSASPPMVENENIYGHARNVASDLIQSGEETEKFIFYRGLGEFKTDLIVTSQRTSLRLRNDGKGTIPQIFLVYTDGKSIGAIEPLGMLGSQKVRNVSAEVVRNLKATSQPQARFLKKSTSLLYQALVAAGLYPDEARAMVKTWEQGYFKTPGLRVLYVLTAQEVESILPAKVTPQPDEFKRAFVGRIEVLLDSDEQRILSRIKTEGLSFDVTTLGRMAQPILLRMRDLAKEQTGSANDISLLSTKIDALISKIQ